MTPDVMSSRKEVYKLAYVRWRGNSAALLATVYEQGRSRQVQLAPLGCSYRVPNGIREHVTEHFPNIVVDWETINQSMAQGPSNAAPLTAEQLSYLEVENHLRDWANVAKSYPGESQQLLAAANVLSGFRSRVDKS